MCWEDYTVQKHKPCYCEWRQGDSGLLSEAGEKNEIMKIGIQTVDWSGWQVVNPIINCLLQKGWK